MLGTTRRLLIVFTVMSAVLVRAGDLNPPPGAIAPTNRVQLNGRSIAMPYTISEPGSYVLTSDLTTVPPGQNGIIIAADDVTLDLNGFTIRGSSGVGALGVAVQGDGVRIHNGRVADWNNSGIDLAGEGGVVTGCIVKGNGIGIRATGNRNRIEDNHATGNATGYDVGGSYNLLVKNSASGNALDYVIGAGNAHGPIVDAAAGGDLSAIPNADHPWANFSVTCTPSTELCDGLDNDCNPSTPDGSADPLIGSSCDGADSDLCQEGTRSCSGGALACSDTTGSTVDLCNGLDDDCDSASADGAEDPQTGTACDGADSDLCAEGTRLCVSGSLACSDTTASTVDLCNGLDDDCDSGSADGAEDPQTGTPCDGPDSDLCAEGTRSCVGGALTCSDNTSSLFDVCNGGIDDDCDPASADGSEDPLLGTPCDGADSDLCQEGTRNCSGGALVCSDTTASTVDLCNGVDDDCDPASADGAEDPQTGTPCDGPDSDLCLEGTRSCSAGALVCSDTTASTVDLCNGFDDDCDPASADGSEDPNCQPPKTCVAGVCQ
ncbi:MAG: right-handed parallel beta-helix repeat-containing protein [Phycisphaerales bacterium]|nr:right-handed parallel beta-helix repeat-containing protein [Phycisphaerales bacterium]